MPKPLQEDRIRTTRTLIYQGPRSWVESTLARGYIKGKHEFSLSGDGRFIESIQGETIVVKPADEHPQDPNAGTGTTSHDY